MKKAHWIIAIGLLSLTSCQSEKSKTDQEASEEPTESWEILFDGKTTDGWHVYAQNSVGPKWTIKEGCLVFEGRAEGVPDKFADGGGDLLTDQKYENFELELEWNISEGGNSGIFYLVAEDTAYKEAWETSPEMQVLDDERHPDAKKGKDGNHKAGSLYDLIPCQTQAVKPAGEWNQVRIVKNNGHVEHWLNGQKVVEFDLYTPEWDEMINNSKFAELPGFAKATSGHISLQDHDNEVWYRNIKIKAL